MSFDFMVWTLSFAFTGILAVHSACFRHWWFCLMFAALFSLSAFVLVGGHVT